MVCLWIRVNAQDYNKRGELVSNYITGFYFVLETSSTIGYGDNTVNTFHGDLVKVPPNDGRYLFAIFMILYGLNYFAYTQSLIVQSITLWFEAKVLAEKKYEDLNDWLTLRNSNSRVILSLEYERKLKDFFVYMTKQDVISALKQKGFINILSNSQKTQLQAHVTSELVEKFSIFDRVSVEMATKIILVGVARTVEKGETVVERGAKPEGIYFILAGEFETMYYYRTHTVILENYKTGDYFGEFGVLGLHSHFDYRCKQSALVLFVTNTELLSLLDQDYTEFTRFLKQVKTNYLSIDELKSDAIKQLGKDLNISTSFDEKPSELEDEEQLRNLMQIPEGTEYQLESTDPKPDFQGHPQSIPTMKELPKSQSPSASKIHEPEPEHHVAIGNKATVKTSHFLVVNHALPEHPKGDVISEEPDNYLLSEPNDVEKDPELRELGQADCLKFKEHYYLGRKTKKKSLLSRVKKTKGQHHTVFQPSMIETLRKEEEAKREEKFLLAEAYKETVTMA